MISPSDFIPGGLFLGDVVRLDTVIKSQEGAPAAQAVGVQIQKWADLMATNGQFSMAANNGPSVDAANMMWIAYAIRYIHQRLEDEMSDHTYRLTDIVGTSQEGLEAAITNGIERASKTIDHLDWMEVTDIRGQIENGEVQHFQVTMKLGFRVEDV